MTYFLLSGDMKVPPLAQPVAIIAMFFSVLFSNLSVISLFLITSIQPSLGSIVNNSGRKFMDVMMLYLS